MIENKYNLPIPTVLEVLSYETILEDNITLLKQFLPEWIPTESDPYMIALESSSYKELHNRLNENERIKKMLPHYASGADLDNFIFGFYGGILRLPNETDAEFLDRSMLSVNRFSTAGAVGAYEYYAYESDSRINDVKVKNDGEGNVLVYIASKETIDEELLQLVEDNLDDEKKRPLSDVVILNQATLKNIDLNIVLEIYDIAKQYEIQIEIIQNLSKFFKIGEDLIHSELISKLHLNGVYKVTTNLNDDVVVSDIEVLKLALNFELSQANVR